MVCAAGALSVLRIVPGFCPGGARGSRRRRESMRRDTTMTHHRPMSAWRSYARWEPGWRSPRSRFRRGHKGGVRREPEAASCPRGAAAARGAGRQALPRAHPGASNGWAGDRPRLRAGPRGASPRVRSRPGERTRDPHRRTWAHRRIEDLGPGGRPRRVAGVARHPDRPVRPTPVADRAQRPSPLEAAGKADEARAYPRGGSSVLDPRRRSHGH